MSTSVREAVALAHQCSLPQVASVLEVQAGVMARARLFIERAIHHYEGELADDARDLIARIDAVQA